MLSQRVKQVLGLIATLLFAIFIFGLSHSISTGFAGFLGRATIRRSSQYLLLGWPVTISGMRQ